MPGKFSSHVDCRGRLSHAALLVCENYSTHGSFTGLSVEELKMKLIVGDYIFVWQQFNENCDGFSAEIFLK
jgi:hypothetical protein